MQISALFVVVQIEVEVAQLALQATLLKELVNHPTFGKGILDGVGLGHFVILRLTVFLESVFQLNKESHCSRVYT